METEHIVKSYDEDLSQLDSLIAEMGGRAEAQLAASIEALNRGDAQAAARIVADDKLIDDLETQIDDLTLRILALRQPMAEDLRAVVAALKAASDLERIGDFVKNNARRVEVLSRTPKIGGTLNSITRMSMLVQEMIQNVLDAYVERDAAKAEDVRVRDEEVDNMYTSLFRELLTYMMENPQNISSCTHLLFVAKNIERIGDHTTNIAEQVYFIVHGERPPQDRPKGDPSPGTNMERMSSL
ncbi:MAG: phosphate signaling complex protein PhoU [Alphaproteobacteria bacterium]